MTAENFTEGNIGIDGHTIKLSGGFNEYNLRAFLSEMHKAISNEKHPRIVLDFSQADYIDSQFMLPALPIICRYRQDEGVVFDMIRADNEGLHKLFINADWAHFIAPDEYKKLDSSSQNHVPAKQFNEPDEQDKCVDDIISVLVNILDLEPNTKKLKIIEWALNEITDNALNHAESSVGGFVQATGRWDIPNPYVEFIVADAGMGIPASLNLGHNHQGALEQAIQEGVTKNKNSNAGNGLYGTYKVATISEGYFAIHSQNAVLRWTKNSGITTHSIPIPYNGTCIICRIMVGKENLLQDALVFGGRKHDPVSIYVEKNYMKGEAMNFNMKEECLSFGSRESGRRAKQKIDNLLAMSENAPIEFDFDGVAVISSSFADEVFGRLFARLGAMQFMQQVKFKNVDSDVAFLIDRAIAQRTKMDLENNS